MTTSATPTATMPQKSRWPRRLWRLARSILLIFLLVTLVLSLMQKLLIFQGAASHGSPDALVNPASDEELLHLTAPTGEKIVALFGKALDANGLPDPDAAHRPTLLYFYGNAMNLHDAALDMRDFRRLGLNVIIPDYVGYGMSSGEAGEPGCYAAAEAVYQHLLTRTDIDPQKLIAAGWSLGAAVAIEIAHRHTAEGHIIGIMTFSAFTSMDDLAQHLFPILPVRLILKHHFKSQHRLAQLKLPILICHGQLDSTIPFAMSQELAQTAANSGAKVTHLPIPGADHNDLFLVGEDQIHAAILKFIADLGA